MINNNDFKPTPEQLEKVSKSLECLKKIGFIKELIYEDESNPNAQINITINEEFQKDFDEFLLNRKPIKSEYELLEIFNEFLNQRLQNN
jgi:hypothetical protein